MTPRPNRAADADPFSALFQLCQPYTDRGTPQPYYLYNGGATRQAIVIYARHVRDAYFERPPTPFEVRLIVEYCAYFIHAPCFVHPAEPLAVLRYEIVRLTTCDELDVWLNACASIGLGNVLGAL
jgi:hypothetical protein